MTHKDQQLNFQYLVRTIEAVNQNLASHADKAVHVSLSLRNWLIDCYISEYQLHGVDRAVYGEKLFTRLTQQLKGVSNCNRRQIYRYLRFFKRYPLPPDCGDTAPTIENIGGNTVAIPFIPPH